MKFAEPSKLNRNPGGWGTRRFVVLPAVPNTDYDYHVKTYGHQQPGYHRLFGVVKQ
jgi:hypothetical protein